MQPETATPTAVETLPAAPSVADVAEMPVEAVVTYVDQLKDYGLQFLQYYGPLALQAALVLFFGWLAARIVRGTVRRVTTKAKLDRTLAGFVTHLAYAVVMVLVVVSALQQLGVQTTSFVAVIGAAGLAIGFALQGSLSNFAAGVMIIVLRPFVVGDTVEAAGVTAKVEEIQLFATVLRTDDKKKVIIPNSAITGGKIVNHSALS